MAAQGYFDQDGNWIEPGDDGYRGGTGNPQDPDAPSGYTSAPPTPTPGPDNPPPPETPPTPTTPPPGGGGGGGGGTLGPFTGHFDMPGMLPYQPYPTLGTPPEFKLDPFKAPSVDEALNDPGYKFRVQQGSDALQGWAAARGTLNDSGTAKSLTDYGQNAASQEYQNVWNRDWSAYQGNSQNAMQANALNYGQQYWNPGQYASQGWRDQTAVTQHTNDMNYRNAWDQYQEQFRQWQDRRNNQQDQAAL